MTTFGTLHNETDNSKSGSATMRGTEFTSGSSPAVGLGRSMIMCLLFLARMESNRVAAMVTKAPSTPSVTVESKPNVAIEQGEGHSILQRDTCDLEDLGSKDLQAQLLVLMSKRDQANMASDDMTKYCRCPDDAMEETPETDHDSFDESMEAEEAFYATLGSGWAASDLPDTVFRMVGAGVPYAFA